MRGLTGMPWVIARLVDQRKRVKCLDPDQSASTRQATAHLHLHCHLTILLLQTFYRIHTIRNVSQHSTTIAMDLLSHSGTQSRHASGNGVAVESSPPNGAVTPAGATDDSLTSLWARYDHFKLNDVFKNVFMEVRGCCACDTARSARRADVD